MKPRFAMLTYPDCDMPRRARGQLKWRRRLGSRAVSFLETYSFSKLQRNDDDEMTSSRGHRVGGYYAITHMHGKSIRIR